MKIDKTKSSSVRKAFGKALTSLGENNNKIVVMDSDLACSTQTKIFADKFPERFFDCGIAEQDMTATAAGLASEVKIPFIASFAVFATGRNYDQIRNGICYPNFNVKIVGTHGGITVGEDGATHQALEDISLMRGLPHMQVFVPADSKECEEIVKYAAEHDGPMYIRVPRGNAIDIFDENYKFENQCEKCERINMTENENIFYFIPKRITEEGIKNLKDVNKTYEFYDEYREIIISKKVAQIIKENVPYVKFYPVILDNRN